MATSTTNTSAAQKQIDRLADNAHGAIDRASEMAERLGDKTDELWGMKDDYVESARDYVKHNPAAWRSASRLPQAISSARSRAGAEGVAVVFPAGRGPAAAARARPG